MRRADRLFQIIQVLRRSKRPVTAANLAAELETSKRSIYRDIAALIGQRVPIRGEAGFGYVLESGFDLPPLMLTSDEVEAAVLGAQWVAGHGDAALARAARDLIAKIEVAVPDNLRPLIIDAAARTPPGRNIPPDGLDVARARAWIRLGRKIALVYRDGEGQTTERAVWPIVIGYHDAVRVLVGWCELRGDFRNFRIDRIAGANFLEERFPGRPAALRATWLATLPEKDLGKKTERARELSNDRPVRRLRQRETACTSRGPFDAGSRDVDGLGDRLDCALSRGAGAGAAGRRYSLRRIRAQRRQLVDRDQGRLHPRSQFQRAPRRGVSSRRTGARL
jgi:predicted DNA-binding transcriptional regulator YafY